VTRRLALVPRYARRSRHPVRSRPSRWIDDPFFRLDYHVRQAALPPPVTPSPASAVARIFSQRLDRHRPLWELRLVEALAGDRFAIISKTHQALVDGVDGADILTVIFDSTRVPVAWSVRVGLPP